MELPLEFVLAIVHRSILSFSGWLSANANTYVIELANGIVAALI